jgi:lysophospholipase L1-like esterase
MLKEMCGQHGFEFLDNENITLDHIGSDGVHLNNSGTSLIYDNILQILHET